MCDLFSRNLSILRRRMGYTQESLAEVLGVSRQAVGKWESGQGLPEAATLITLADLLGCSLDQLMREPLTETDAGALSVPTPEEAWQAVYDAYHEHIGRFARSIALGVFLVLAGLSLTALAAAFLLPDGLSAGIFFLFLIGAVFLFITAGMADEDFSKNYPDVLPLYAPEERLAFQKTFREGVALCVGGILADVAACAVLGGMGWANNGMEMYIGAGFLGVLALCVGPLVYLGCLSERYEPERRSHKKKDDFSGAIMLLATAAFLIWGLVWDGWQVSWVCFLIGAALCIVAEQGKKGS